MHEVITNLIDVPFARMFVLSGIVFLLVAVLGKVEGKIEPGNVGRIGASVLGIALMIIGVAMQYLETRDAALQKLAQQAQVQPQNSTPASIASIPPKPAVPADATPADRPAIKVVGATYGRSCNGKAGNATPLIAKFCDGKSACDYSVEPVELEAATANCARDFAAEWKCGTSNTVYSAVLPAGAGSNEKLHLACAG